MPRYVFALCVIIAASTFAFATTPGDSFRVSLIIVLSRYNATFLLQNANANMPPDRIVSDSDISRFREEMLATGLFRDLKIVKTKTTRPGEFQLRITPTYIKGYSKVTIAEFDLSRLLQIDAPKFLSALKQNGLAVGQVFSAMGFNLMGEIVNSALAATMHEDPDYVSTWMRVRYLGNHRLKLIVGLALNPP